MAGRSARPGHSPYTGTRIVFEREQLHRGGLADRFRIKFASNASISLAKTHYRFHRNPRYYDLELF